MRTKEAHKNRNVRSNDRLSSMLNYNSYSKNTRQNVNAVSAGEWDDEVSGAESHCTTV